MNAFFRTSRCRRANNGQSLVFTLHRRSRQRSSMFGTGSPVHYSSQEVSHFSSSESLARCTRVPQVLYGFRELGIHDSMTKAIEKAFPDVQRPTIAQAEFIPAILNGKDVLLHDETGTGKSFGSIVALLSKPRTRASRHGTRQDGPCITSLVIVPHRDLGYQMMHWIESILKHSGSDQPSTDSIAQFVARSDSMPVDEQIRKLRTTPPHILIGTPQALWDIYCSDQRALQLEDLTTLVVDEVDYLLDIPPPYVRKSREGPAWKNFKKHPSLSRQLLEIILPTRNPGAVPLAEIDYNDDDSDVSGRYKHKKTVTSAVRPLQVVMSSATVHSNLTDFLCDARWLGGDRVILSGKQLLKTNSHMASNEGTRKPRIVHHAFVVSLDGGGLENIEFAVRPGEEDTDEDEEKGVSSKHQGTSGKPQSGSPQSPTSPAVMEAVASIFAFDVPHLALLVIPPGSSVRRVILELQDLGIDARMLDLRSRDISRLGRPAGQAEAEPILLVATPATIRGVDLPQLTHVFCAGAPDTGSADVFKHVAGRVGRFGRGGKVITIVTEREVEHREGILRTTKNPAGLLNAFYRKLHIRPIWFDLSAVGFNE